MGTARKKQEVVIEGRTVGLSNLDKVLYGSGFSKGQVIDYYIRIADYLLPHLKDRPVTLKRYPEGTRGAHFYEKDAPSFTPDWVRTFSVPRRAGGEINYIIIDDLPTLVWCANTANLEVHPFLHRVPEIQRPTAIVFDLDPGEGTDILNCAEVAFWLREELEGMGLKSFAKVSGSKGMQIYAPLNKPVTYAETQPFARRMAELLELRHPRAVVSAMAKERRKGEVFIDWSQNSDFKTTVAVYSLRAKQETPYVSMPVTWDELKAARRKRSAASLYWEQEAALRRVAEVGDIFAPVLTLRQRMFAQKVEGLIAKRRGGIYEPGAAKR